MSGAGNGCNRGAGGRSPSGTIFVLKDLRSAVAVRSQSFHISSLRPIQAAHSGTSHGMGSLTSFTFAASRIAFALALSRPSCSAW
eukprot:1953878-Pyramimonas_sp.AAC.1